MKKINLLLLATLLAGSLAAQTNYHALVADETIYTYPDNLNALDWFDKPTAYTTKIDQTMVDPTDITKTIKLATVVQVKQGNDSKKVAFRVTNCDSVCLFYKNSSSSANRGVRALVIDESGTEQKFDSEQTGADPAYFGFALIGSKSYSITIQGMEGDKGGDVNLGIIYLHTATPKTDPWLTLSATEVELAVTPFATSDEAKVTLKGGNLTADTYTLTVPEVAGLTVAPTSVKVAADGTVNQEITLTYTSDVDVLKTKAQLSVTINEILAQLDITYSALLTVDAITIFHWQMSGTGAPVAGTALTATGGTIMPGTTDSGKSFGVESAGYVGGVPDDMKAKDGKGVKFGGNVLSFKVALADNAIFKAGDIVSICGYSPWKISSTSTHLGDLAASVVTGTDKSNYAVGQVVLTADADTLYLMRAEGSSTAIAAIKVERPTECADAEVALPENPDIEVANSALTITAPTLENPNGLVVKYVSSDAEVVAVDENTGALTKGTKTGMATITISWVRQTINTVRHCAGELAYTVTVKDGATEISNAEAYAPAQKVIRDGQLLIIRDGKTYTAQGVQVQ